MARLRRFLHLERPRPEEPPSGASPARGRFEAVEVGPAVPDVAAASLAGATRDRFRASPDSGLALDTPQTGEQPFVRCASCGSDHPRQTPHCSRCGASLETSEQRAFNARLWAERCRESEEERRAGEARREMLRRDAEEAAQARRAAAEAMSAEILRRERERLRQPWLIRLLRLLGQGCRRGPL